MTFDPAFSADDFIFGAARMFKAKAELCIFTIAKIYNPATADICAMLIVFGQGSDGFCRMSPKWNLAV